MINRRLKEMRIEKKVGYYGVELNPRKGGHCGKNNLHLNA